MSEPITKEEREAAKTDARAHQWASMREAAIVRHLLDVLAAAESEAEKMREAARATEGDTQRLTVEIARLRALIESAQVFVHVVADNWDCDCDEHRHGTGCRSCEATALAARLDEEVSRG